MTTGALRADMIAAAASFLGADGQVSANNQTGSIASSVRNGAGDYTITLTPGCDATQCVFLATLRGGAIDGWIQVNPLTDTTVQVLTGTVAAAADRNFDLFIMKSQTANA